LLYGKKESDFDTYFQFTTQIVGFLQITKFLFNLFPTDQQILNLL